MQAEGCEIHAVVNDARTDQGIAEILSDAGIPFTYFPRIHSKYFILDGTYEGIEGRWVWTGSQNFSGAGLTGNDNVILEIANPELYEAFLEDWSTLQSHPDAFSG
jgi:phosphatidylserine/phosphatidylglycerophosphate/cardiolipin synthase-like enzyme